MKSSFILLTIASLLFPHSGEKKEIINGPDVSIMATIRACYELELNDSIPRVENADIYFYLLEVKLVNNSKSSVDFLTYSCATIGNIVVNQKFIKVCANRCVNNQVTTIKLEPGQEFSVTAILRTNRVYSRSKIKIGWILLTYKNTGSPGNFNEALERSRSRFENVLWSGPIDLQYPSNHNYEISDSMS